MRTSEHDTERLSAYLDGELEARDREALEAHLRECTMCSELLGELRDVVGAAATMEDRDPERDLWPGIEARLAPRTALRQGAAAAAGAEALVSSPRRVGGSAAGRRVRRISLTVPQLLAAGIALVLFSAGGAWVALAPVAAGPPGTPVASGPGAAASEAAPAAAPSVAFAAAYETAIAELETAFRERRATLDPETITVVERNLAIIDAAIADARRALAEDPASGFLNTHLASAMRRKVDLLRQATSIERTES